MEMDKNREKLVEVIKAFLPEWEKWRAKHSLLGPNPSRNDILEPVLGAIEATDVYKRAVGHSLFSGYAGVVITSDRLAMPMLHRADFTGATAEDGADWLYRVLTTEHAPGHVIVPIWGVSVDSKVHFEKSMWLMPFSDAPASFMKDRIVALSRKHWEERVWIDTRFFDLPAAAFVQRVARFPYFENLAKSFQTLDDIHGAMEDRLVFLSAIGTGQPLVGASWFEFDDRDIDFNSMQNYRRWIMPEVVPSIKNHIHCDATAIAKAWKGFRAYPSEWRNTLQRAMKRFILSRCRHQFVDQVLDLAIAFEIAVGSKGDGAPVSWKVAVRASQLIGGRLDERLKNRMALAEFYKLRNTGSHGGNVASERDKLEAAVELFRSLLSALMGHATPPNWQSIEMGPPAVG